MRFFKKDFGNKNLIVLDIGSQFVKALLLEVDKNEKRGTLLAWARENFVDDFDKLCLNCQRAIRKAENKAGIKAKEIFLGIEGDTLKGSSTTFCCKRENPKEKIDLTELKYIIQKVQWKAFEKIRKEFSSETGTPETEIRLVSAHIVDIKVDNSHLANPLGFQGENICISIFNNYTSIKLLEDLIKLVAYLGLDLIGINSPSYALFRCLDLDHSAKEDTLIIDVGGKNTEITLIKGGGELIEARNFHLGGHLFTRTIAEFLDMGTEEAEAVKIKYSKEGVSAEAKKRIEKLMSSNLFSWGGGVKVVLDELLKKYRVMPSKIFLCGGGSNLPIIKDVLRKRMNLKANHISPSEIIKIKNKTKFEEIPSLALAALVLESLEINEFSATLKRAVRLIQG